MLTRREWEVAQLIARGMSTREIATALSISGRTAESHCHRVSAKLELRSREEIVAWVEEYRQREGGDADAIEETPAIRITTLGMVW